MTSSNATRTFKSLAHAAALIFGAFWLVATTDVGGPPRECFTGTATETKLRVTLGEPILEIDGGTQSLPSCNALDGLVTGAAPTFTLSQPAKGPFRDGYCHGYEISAIEGTTGVTLSERTPFPQSDVFTLAHGSYSGASGCHGDWAIEVAPETVPPSGDLISPLDAGAEQRWVVLRSMQFNQVQTCGGTFADPGVLGCEDRFLVDRIEVAP